jgi:hypothetical protein
MLYYQWKNAANGTLKSIVQKDEKGTTSLG